MWIIRITNIQFTPNFKCNNMAAQVVALLEYLIYSLEVFTHIIPVLKYADNQTNKYILYSGFEMQ